MNATYKAATSTDPFKIFGREALTYQFRDCWMRQSCLNENQDYWEVGPIFFLLTEETVRFVDTLWVSEVDRFSVLVTTVNLLALERELKRWGDPRSAQQLWAAFPGVFFNDHFSWLRQHDRDSPVPIQ